MRPRGDRGFTAVEMIVVVIVVGIAAAVTLPALLRGSRNLLHARCESNLRALWKAESDYRAKNGATPAARGSAYWAAVLGPGADPGLLVCPLSKGARYRGPAADPTPLPPMAVIGSDAPGNHGEGEGGYILFKNGEVRACRETDALWKLAGERLVP
jgi:prepilin-type N-terminal cleavage/methylation domain-containing protein